LTSSEASPAAVMTFLSTAQHTPDDVRGVLSLLDSNPSLDFLPLLLSWSSGPYPALVFVPGGLYISNLHCYFQTSDSRVWHRLPSGVVTFRKTDGSGETTLGKFEVITLFSPRIFFSPERVTVPSSWPAARIHFT